MALTKEQRALMDGHSEKGIFVRRILFDVMETLEGAAFLSQAVYWTLCNSRVDGWFYKSAEEWTNETLVTHWQQRAIRKKLKEMGLLEEKRRIDRPEMYYRVNPTAYCKMIIDRQPVESTYDDAPSEDESTSPDGENLHPAVEESTSAEWRNPPLLNRSIDLQVQDVQKQNLQVHDSTAPDTRKKKQIYKAIAELCHEVFGHGAENRDWVNKKLKALADSYGYWIVVDGFREWAKETVGTQHRRPVADFLAVANDRLRYAASSKKNPDVIGLSVKLLEIHDLPFSRKNLQGLRRLQGEYPEADIVAAYRRLVGMLDEFGLRTAPAQFVEGGADSLIALRRKEIQAEQDEEATRVQERAMIAEQKRVTDAEEAAKKAEEEAELALQDEEIASWGKMRVGEPLTIDADPIKPPVALDDTA